MVALRTFSNPVEAAMAKSLLDDHKISCILLDENVNLYGGGPLAMPIRLMVVEDQAEEAARILETKGPEISDDFDPGVEETPPNEIPDVNQQILSEVRGFHYTNQWILLIAIIILIFALYLVYEIPRHTSPWSSVYEAMRHYDYERAVILAKRIVRDHPQDYYAHEYLGYIYLQMGNLNQAEAEYSRASQLALPESLQGKLKEIRERIDRGSRPRPSATPIPWP